MLFDIVAFIVALAAIGSSLTAIRILLKPTRSARDDRR